MQQSIQARTNGVAFRRPVFHAQCRRFARRLMRQLEWLGRRRAAAALSRQGYHEYAKNLLEGGWK